MAARISAFQCEVDLPGPTPELHATFRGTHFNMGETPVSGTWTLSVGLALEHCGSAAVFSEDGLWFAAPVWLAEYEYHKEFKRLTAVYGQQVVAVELASRQLFKLAPRYRVVELHSFRDGLVEGEDDLQTPIRLRVAAAPRPA